MQEQKSQIYNVNTESNGNTKLEERIARELEISPIVVLNNKKIVQIEQNKIVFSSEDIKNDYIEDLERLLKIENIDKDIILTSLYNDFGLLIERAPGLYSFSHLSLQEF